MAELEEEVRELTREQEIKAARLMELEAKLERERAAQHAHAAAEPVLPPPATALTPDPQANVERFRMTPGSDLPSFSDTVHPTMDGGSPQPPHPTGDIALLLTRFAQLQADMAAMKLTVERQNTVINRQRGVIEEGLETPETLADLSMDAAERMIGSPP